MIFNTCFLNRICYFFFAKTSLLLLLFLTLSSSWAEVLCSFRITSVPVLQKLCSGPSSSLMGYCLSATIRDPSSLIPYKSLNPDAPVYGAFVSVPEKMEYHFILFFPLDSYQQSIPLPQKFFSRTIENYSVFSLSPEALSQASDNFLKIKNNFKDTRGDISIFCSAKQTWKNLKVTAELLRGLFLLSQSSEPDLQKLNFQLFEFGFFLLDSLNEIRVTVHKNPDSQNQVFHFIFNFFKDSPINELFPEKPSSNLSEKLSSPDALFRLVFNPLKVKESAFRILELLQNRMGFKPEDILRLKKNLTDFLGTNPAPGLFILDCQSPLQNTNSPFIRIQHENLPLNLKMLSEKLKVLINPLPFTLIMNTPAEITSAKRLSAELQLPSGQTLKSSLPSLLTLLFNYFTPVNSLLDFSFREKNGILYGTPEKDSILDFNPSLTSPRESNPVFPFLQIKIKYSDFRNLYQACFPLKKPAPILPLTLKDNLELSVKFYYNEQGLNISLTLPNPLLEIPL